MDDRFQAMLDEVRTDTIIARAASKGFAIVKGQLTELRAKVAAMQIDQASGLNISAKDVDSFKAALDDMHGVMTALQTDIPANTGEEPPVVDTPAPAGAATANFDDPHDAPAVDATAQPAPVDSLPPFTEQLAPDFLPPPPAPTPMMGDEPVADDTHD